MKRADPFTDPYEVLGVDRDATPEEVVAAYREKCKKCHPDLGGDEQEFIRVQHAYEQILQDIETRGAGDATAQPGTANATRYAHRRRSWTPALWTKPAVSLAFAGALVLLLYVGYLLIHSPPDGRAHESQLAAVRPERATHANAVEESPPTASVELVRPEANVALDDSIEQPLSSAPSRGSDNAEVFRPVLQHDEASRGNQAPSTGPPRRLGFSRVDPLEMPAGRKLVLDLTPIDVGESRSTFEYRTREGDPWQVATDSRLTIELAEPGEYVVQARAVVDSEVSSNILSQPVKVLPAPEKLTWWDQLNLGNAAVRGCMVRVKAGTSIFTKESYSGPIEIEVEARADKNSIRILAFNNSLVIFNWEVDPSKLPVWRPSSRIHSSPNLVIYPPFQPLSKNTWHALRWRIAEDGMEIRVDGKIVFWESEKYDLLASWPVHVASYDSNIDVRAFSVNSIKQQ
jgi:hypothetical protein